jgi:hypothetical protein
MASEDVLLDVVCSVRYSAVEDDPETAGEVTSQWRADLVGNWRHYKQNQGEPGFPPPGGVYLYDTHHEVKVTGTFPPPVVTDNSTDPPTVTQSELDVPLQREKQYRVVVTEV